MNNKFDVIIIGLLQVEAVLASARTGKYVFAQI